MNITHINKDGNANMVDISNKIETLRIAKAQAVLAFDQEVYDIVKHGTVKKGDILSVAQVAGIMAAKNTSTIIPMCHPLLLDSIDITYEFNDNAHEVTIISTVKLTGKTGVEMEALTAASVTALTIYDMTKALDKLTIIKEIKLLEKSGGKSGDVKRWKY